MDLLAHALWTTVGVVALQRRLPIGSVAASAAVAASVLPDLVHGLPVLAWVAVGDGTWAQAMAYSVATLATEPVLPQWVAMWSHHLHCMMHSLIVLGAVALVAWPWRRKLWLPLASWCLHIVIDVFTHSSAFYPVPIFYPITQRGFDGIAWNTPWFATVNYGVMALAAVWLWLTRRKADAA